MKILIVKLSSIGDLFHALPAVHGLKTGLKAEIHWVVNREYAELVGCFTDVSRIIPFYRRSFFRDFGSFTRELRRDSYDLVVDLQGLLKSAIVARLARSGRRIGPSFQREGAFLFYSDVAGKSDLNRHAVEQCLDVVKYLGLPDIEPGFPVEFPKYTVEGERPRVAILPASRWPTKNWPAEKFASVADGLIKQKRADISLIGGSEARGACDAIEAALPGKVRNLCGKRSLIETGGALKEIDLLIACDSGPVHMAAAVGTPVLVVFGPTDPVRTGPYGKQHRVLSAEVPCRPCFSRACARGDLQCMTRLEPETVIAAALEMLEKS